MIYEVILKKQTKQQQDPRKETKKYGENQIGLSPCKNMYISHTSYGKWNKIPTEDHLTETQNHLG